MMLVTTMKGSGPQGTSRATTQSGRSQLWSQAARERTAIDGGDEGEEEVEGIGHQKEKKKKKTEEEEEDQDQEQE